MNKVQTKKAEAEVKAIAIKYFEDNHSDEFGYVTEKREKIEVLEYGDAWMAHFLLHFLVRMDIFATKLSPRARKYMLEKTNWQNVKTGYNP